MNGLSGVSGAARLVQRVLTDLHRSPAVARAAPGFPPPRGYRQTRICALSGRPAGHACDRTVAEWLRPADVPVEPCSVHVAVAVDAGTGGAAGSATPSARRREKPCLALPARFALWAADEGVPSAPRGGDGDLEASSVRISAPQDGLRVTRCPDVPAETSTLALEAVVEGGPGQVVWYVDDAPFCLVDFPFRTRWPLSPGEHRFQARLPDRPGVSPVVRVRVE